LYRILPSKGPRGRVSGIGTYYILRENARVSIKCENEFGESGVRSITI
jgi:hypothetical protein